MKAEARSHFPVAIRSTARNMKMKCQNINKISLPGFTLLEQIIVLALTTILVLIGFTAVLNFQQLIVKVRDNAAKNRSVYLLHDVLENDFRNSESISWDGIRLNIDKVTETVRYEFGNLCLIREATEAIDTFRFAANDVAISGVKGNSALVEAISFNISDQIQSYRMSFSKKYPEYKIWEAMEYGN